MNNDQSLQDWTPVGSFMIHEIEVKAIENALINEKIPFQIEGSRAMQILVGSGKKHEAIAALKNTAAAIHIHFYPDE